MTKNERFELLCIVEALMLSDLPDAARQWLQARKEAIWQAYLVRGGFA